MVGRAIPLGTALVTVFVIAVSVLPSLWLLGHAGLPLHDEAALHWLKRGSQPPLWRSLKLIAAVAGFSFAIGWPLGTAIGWHGRSVRAACAVLQALPLLMPPFLWAVGVQGLKAWLSFRHQIWADGFSGHVVASLISAISLVSMLTSAGASWTSSAAAEAALLMGGAGRLRRALLRQTLPLALGVALLAGLLASADVGTGLMMGFQGAAGDVQASFATGSGFEKAATRASLMALAFLPLALGSALLISRAVAGTRFGAAQRLGAAPGAGKGGGRACLLLLAVVLPMAIGSAGWARTLLAGYAGPAFRDAWLVWRESAGATATLAGLVALFLACLAAPLGWIVGRSDHATRAVLAAGLVVCALPPSIHALGWLLIVSKPGFNRFSPGFAPAMMALALTARWLLLGVWFGAIARRRLPLSALDAAELCGLSTWARWRKLVLPTVGRSLALPAAACACAGLADVVACALLQPPGRTTYAMRLFAIMDNAPEKQVAAMCLTYLIVPACLALALAVAWLLARLWGSLHRRLP